MELAQASLIINQISLALCFLLAWRSFRHNNAIALIYWTVFAFLVVGQGIHIALGLQETAYVTYLYNNIGREGHLIASISVMGIILYVGLLDAFSRSTFSTQLTVPHLKLKAIARIPGLFYILHWAYFTVVSFLLFRLIGGLGAWQSTSRAEAPGTTFFIIGLSLVEFPLLIKIASNIRLRMNDYLLFFAALIAILMFSRIMALFQLLMLSVVFLYSSPIRGSAISLKRYFAPAIGVGVLLCTMFFGFGSYRHVAPELGTASLSDLIQFLKENPDKSLFSLDLNYRIGIEGMSGISGVITQTLESNHLQADLGLSLFKSVFQLVPSALRGIFGDLPTQIESLYWYQGSVVGAGLEAFFVHFSFLGLLFFAGAFYAFAYQTHRRILATYSSSNLTIRTPLLFWAIVAVFGLMLIRGSSANLLFYTTCELLVMIGAVWLFRAFHTFARESREDMLLSPPLQQLRKPSC